MNKTLLLTAVAVAFAAAPLTAQAQQAENTGFYAGGGYSFLEADELSFGGINLLGGYTFSEYFAAEGEVFIGLDGEETNTGAGSASLDANYGFGGYAKAQYPVAENVNLFARAGYASYEVEASASVPGLFTGSDTETYDGFAYGVGGELFFDDANGVRLDYTRFEIEEFDDAGLDTPYSINVSYVRRF